MNNGCKDHSFTKRILACKYAGRPQNDGNDQDYWINMAMLLLQALHALHQGVSGELQIREQCALTVLIECKVKNAKMYEEKKQVVKEKEEKKAQRTNLESVIEQAYQIVLELHLLDGEQAVKKVIKLDVAVHDAKDEIRRVIFKFQMKIVELQLKLQPTTPPEV